MLKKVPPFTIVVFPRKGKKPSKVRPSLPYQGVAWRALMDK